MRHQRNDLPSAADWARELAAAWLLVGALALAAIAIEPTSTPADIPAGTQMIAGPARVATSDGFENDADRAAALAGYQDEPDAVSVARARAAIPASRAAEPWHVYLCHWIAGAAGAKHSS